MDTAEKVATAIKPKITPEMKENDKIALMGPALREMGFNNKEVTYMLSYDQDFIPDVLANLK